jgi:hypothetical protein
MLTFITARSFAKQDGKAGRNTAMPRWKCTMTNWLKAAIYA